MRTTLAAVVAVPLLAWMVAAQILDTSFRAGSPPILKGPDGPVFAMAEGPDETVVIAGDFARVNGIRRNGIARLRADGTLDPSWDAGAGADGVIRSVVIGSDGSVLVGGDFSNWGAVPAGGHLVRLKPDGSLDDRFDGGPAFSGSVLQVLRLSNDGLLVLGTTTEGGPVQPYLQHRGPDGAVDPGFRPTLPEGVALNALALETAGSVLVVGRFQSFDGVAATNLVRLRPDLTLDSGFQSATAAGAGELFCVAAAADGRIAVGGVVTNPFPESVLGVLAPDGQPDPNFVRPVGFFEPFVRVSFDAAGDLLAVGAYPFGFTFLHRFSPSGVHGDAAFLGHRQGAAPLARRNGRALWALDGVTNERNAVWSWLLETLPGGAIHSGFNSGPAPAGELPWPLDALALMPDGDVIAPGPTGLRTNLTTAATAFQQDLVRLDPNGTVRTGFVSSATIMASGINALIPAEDGGLFAAGEVNAVNWDARSPLVARLDANGTLDPGFLSGLKPGDWNSFWPATVNHAARLDDGRVVVAGTYVPQVQVGFGETTLLGRFLPDGSRDPEFKFLTVVQTRTSAYIGTFAILDPDHFVLWGKSRDSGTPTLFGYSAQGDSVAGPVLETAPGLPVQVSVLVPQRDGRILVGGSFGGIGGAARRHLARLLPDLTVDPSLDTGSGPDGPVTAAVELSDGRLLVAGSFTHWNGQPLRRLALLNPDGSLASGFSAGSGPDDDILELVEQPDGRVLAAGRFGSFDGAGSPRLVRLQLPAAVPPVPAHLLVQPVTTVSTNAGVTLALVAQGIGTPPLKWQWFRNGSPLAAADGFGGVATPELVIPPARAAEAASYQVEISNAFGLERSQSVVAGLASGTMDFGFTTNRANRELRIGGVNGGPGSITGLVADRDANGRARRVLIIGGFDLYDRAPVPGLVVVRPDGTRDESWNPPAGVTGAETLAAAFRPDGRLVLAGRFSRLRGAPRDVVLQLRSDGSLDESFDPGDELTVTPPDGFPRQTAAVGLALDGEGAFIASGVGAGLPYGFVRRLDGAGRTDRSFVATNAMFFGTPSVLQVEPRLDGGLLVGGIQFAAQERRGSQTLFRGLARFLRDGRLDPGFNANPRRPDMSASGDVTAVIPLAGGNAWVGGTFAEFDRAPGPLVWLDSTGTADTNFSIRIPSDPPVRFPGKSLLGMSPLEGGDWLLNFRPPVKGADSIVRMRSDGTVVATAGSGVDAQRNAGPVVDLGDGSYLTPITVKSTFPARTRSVVGRFWLTELSAAPSATLPPVLLRGPENVTLTLRPGVRQPLVLSVVAQAGGEVRYQWYRNGVPVESGNGPVLRVDDPRPGENDGPYRVDVSNASGHVTAEARVTLIAAPPEAPLVTGRWIGGPRPLRLQFRPVEGRTYSLEASDTLGTWIREEDSGAVSGPGEFAPRVGDSPRFFRVVEEP